MSGPERHRRENGKHPARQPRDGRREQRQLKITDPVGNPSRRSRVFDWLAGTGMHDFKTPKGNR